MTYTTANTDWLALCRYGLAVHWTAKTMPRRGEPLPFQKAVEAFNLDAFVDGVIESGADYVFFTCTHALQMMPAPNPVIDRILPGRTSERDLIGEIATRLAAHRKHFMFYYNHSCNQADDPEWEMAVGYHAQPKERFASNLCEIVSWMGRHYGESVRAWWFDSSYSLDPRGPNNSVTTDLAGFHFPWERMTEAAKEGFGQRLVTYNAGVNETFLYTTHQDYWAGEMVALSNPAKARYLENGLQWHGLTYLDDRTWIHSQRDTDAADLLYADDELFSFVRECNLHQAPVCFNVSIYQDGTMSSKAIKQLKNLGARLPGRNNPVFGGILAWK